MEGTGVFEVGPITEQRQETNPKLSAAKVPFAKVHQHLGDDVHISAEARLLYQKTNPDVAAPKPVVKTGDSTEHFDLEHRQERQAEANLTKPTGATPSADSIADRVEAAPVSVPEPPAPELDKSPEAIVTRVMQGISGYLYRAHVDHAEEPEDRAIDQLLQDLFSGFNEAVLLRARDGAGADRYRPVADATNTYEPSNEEERLRETAHLLPEDLVG